MYTRTMLNQHEKNLVNACEMIVKAIEDDCDYETMVANLDVLENDIKSYCLSRATKLTVIHGGHHREFNGRHWILVPDSK